MLPNPSDIDFVIYHASCCDGMGAAWAAWKLLGDKATYYAADHGTPPPDVTDKTVAILDFSYDLGALEAMQRSASGIVVLDHHISAQNDLTTFENASFDMLHSGAIMAWNYFHPGEEAPLFLKYIEDRDLWKWELPFSREFSSYFCEVPFTFSDYDAFLDEEKVNYAISAGSHILPYINTCVEKLSSKASREVFLENTVAILNCGQWMSDIGNVLAKDSDIAIVWYYNNKSRSYKISLRTCSETIDVSKIAKIWGGGGHQKAAAFSLGGDANIRLFFEQMKSMVLC